MAPERTHKESQKVVCFLCMKNTNRELTDTFKQKILEVHQVLIDFSDTRVPSGICFGYHTALWKVSNGEKVNLPCSFNYKVIKTTKITQESNFCECLICKTERVKGWSKIPVSSSESKRKNVQGQYVQKRCSNCFSINGPGIPHSFNKTSLHQNLVEVASKDKLAANTIAKNLLTTSPSSPKGTILLSQPSHLFPVQIGSSSKPKELASLTVKDLVQL